jgi:hypothetical protein
MQNDMDHGSCSHDTNPKQHPAKLLSACCPLLETRIFSRTPPSEKEKPLSQK